MNVASRSFARITRRGLSGFRTFLIPGVLAGLVACEGALEGRYDSTEQKALEAKMDSIARTGVPERFDAARETFEAACASCHGKYGAGALAGPPLIHEIYRPSHHADAAFTLAVLRGVRAHHWRYGDMPPVRGVDQQEGEAVTAYVRWLQEQAGIH